MQELRYSLIRYIPDPIRMEPVNAGLILQDSRRIDFRLNPHFGRRAAIDNEVFKAWRHFFEEEIQGENMPLLQPAKTSPKFFEHLRSLCNSTVRLSPTLSMQVHPDESFEEIIQRLYDQLVAAGPKEREAAERASATFRDWESDRKFLKRGLSKHPYIRLGSTIPSWNAFRATPDLAETRIVVDKIEIGNQVGLAASEIQMLYSGVEQFLQHYLNAKNSSRSYYLIADPLISPFNDQPPDDFSLMQEQYGIVLERVRKLGGHVLQKQSEAATLGKKIDETLPASESSLAG